MSDDASTVDPGVPETQPKVAQDGALPATPTVGWILGVVMAAVVGWIALSFFPLRFTLPADLTEGTVQNNPAKAAEAAEMGELFQWRNGLVNTTLIGLCFGLFPAALGGIGITRTLLAVVVGGACGFFGGLLGMAIGQAMIPADPEASLDDPSMWSDVIVYVIASSLIALPAGMLFLRSTVAGGKQKFASVPLGGLLAGLLLPILASFVLPDVKTNLFPPENFALAAVWLGLIAAFAIILSHLTGSADKAPASS